MNIARIVSILVLLIATSCMAKPQHQPCELINALLDRDSAVIDSISNALGLDRDASGLESVRCLYPHIVNTDGPTVVVAMSWSGPTDGWLLSLGSDGEMLGQRRVGYFKSIALRPFSSARSDNVVLDCIVGTGTGSRIDSFYVFSLENAFSLIWSGLSYESSFPGVVSPEDNYEKMCFLAFQDLNSDHVDELLYETRFRRYAVNMGNVELSPLTENVERTVYRLVGGTYQKAATLDQLIEK